MNEELKNFIPVSTWGIGYYIVNVYHNRFTESEQAEKYLQTQKFAILSQLPDPRICIVLSQSQKTIIQDSQIIINTIPPERKKKLGIPLDTQLTADKETAIEALETDNPAYVIDEGELIKSKKTITDLIEKFGNGYRLEFLGCCVEAT